MTYLRLESPNARVVEGLIRLKAPKCKYQMLEYDFRGDKASQELVQKHAEFHNSHLLNIIVCNHGTRIIVPIALDLSTSQWHETFDTNFHAFFYLCKAASSNIPSSGSIMFNACINPQVGHPELVDYTTTKGAIFGLARALSNQIVGEKGIRVDAVTPGPIWMPLRLLKLTISLLVVFTSYLTTVQLLDSNGQVVNLSKWQQALFSWHPLIWAT